MKCKTWLGRELDVLEKIKLEEIKDQLPEECEICGSKKRLSIHHIKPKGKYPQLTFEISNCKRLCIRCHKKIHEK